MCSNSSQQSTFKDIVKRCIIKNQAALNKICAPLKDCLGIDKFGFLKIHNDGTYCHLTTKVEVAEYFYEKKLYFSEPHIRSPQLFEPGFTIIPVAKDPLYQEISKNKYQTDHMLIILKKFEYHMEIFFFVNYNTSESGYVRLLHQLHLLNKFVPFFRREATKLINNVQYEGFNAGTVLGEAFHSTDPNFALYRKELRAEHFLKSISPLSPREQACLDLYKLGYSAQATAAILKISNRTVEHHFENIKLKLGCFSKSELCNF